MTDGQPDPARHRLDPDRAAAAARPPSPEKAPEIDTRRYRWAIGIFGTILVIVGSIYGFARNGVGSPGVAPGKPLHRFVAPLATAGVDLDANANPRCDPLHPNPHGLNVCGRTPLVLAFFVTGSSSCTREVDALQVLSRQPTLRSIQFAALAVHADRGGTLAAVRRHGWTIPVAYDRDGSVADLYGIRICPIVELAYRGGTVARRLIGEHWSRPAALVGQVRVLVGRVNG